MNRKANAKAILTFQFSTLYTKLPYFDLINVVNDITEFRFKGGNKKHNDLSGNRTFWCHKPKHIIFL